MAEELNITFKKFVFFYAMTVLLSVGIVYALAYEFKPQSSAQTLPTAEGINEQFGLELTMTLQKTEYSLGEPVNITLTLTNISNETISFGISRWGDRFDFRVYNGTNNPIYPLSETGWFPFGNDFITLNAGESLTVGQVAGYPPQLTRYYAWEQLGKFPGESLTSVSPGTYYIVGQTGPIGGINGKPVDAYGVEGSLVIETTPIQVTIVKP